MNVLLANPELPLSFWSLRQTCASMEVKAVVAPLGLATVAALLPRQWNLRIVDLNVQPVTEADWNWTEMILITGMIVQQDGLLNLVREAKARGKTVVVGGPYATAVPEPVLEAGADYVIRGEGENLVPEFLEALKNGNTRQVFESSEKPPMTASPVPRFDLLSTGDYVAMAIQASRGCPYDCEFCDIISLFGRQVRCKTADQVIQELEAIYQTGWRGVVFVCDDNFIGHKAHARAVLAQLIPWMENRGYPFDFWTQASVDLGGDPEMIDLMTAANFSHVFIGVESPDKDVLELNHKHQNIRHPPLESLRAINRNGLSVIASFVLGFDNERPGAGRRICEFVETASVPIVELNILQVSPNTRLWNRLEREGRLLKERTSGQTTGGQLNYVPTRPETEIIEEFHDAWNYLYAPSRCLARAFHACLEMRPTRRAMAAARGERQPPHIAATRATWAGRLHSLRQFLRLVAAQGIMPPLSFQFWGQFAEIKKNNPSRLIRYLGQCDFGENMFHLGIKMAQKAAAVGAEAARKTSLVR
ncbi:MAG: B12-binding domain-containing radical SAM protein [Verrucomicrobiia bacterium]